jgi:hypothetical protein
MADKTLLAVPALIATLLTATACTEPDAPPTPRPSATPAPITASPLDVSRYSAFPCSGVPAEISTQLTLPKRQDAHDTVLIGAGEQAQGRLSSGPPLSAAAEVRFYPKALTGPAPALVPPSSFYARQR